MKPPRKASDFSAGASNFSANSLNNTINNNKFSFSSNNLGNLNPTLLLRSPFDLNSKAPTNSAVLSGTRRLSGNDADLSCERGKDFLEQAELRMDKDPDGLRALARNLALLERNFWSQENTDKAEIDTSNRDENLQNNNNEYEEAEINFVESYENSEAENNENTGDTGNNGIHKLKAEKENADDKNLNLQKTKITENKNLLAIKIKTSNGNTEVFLIEKQFTSEPELLRKSLCEFIESKKLNKDLLSPIIARINETVYSLNEIMQQKINKKFLEDFSLLKKDYVPEDMRKKEDLEFEEILNKNFFKDGKKLEKFYSEKDLEFDFNREEQDEQVSFLPYRTSVSTCQSEDEDESCDLLLNKTL